MARFKAHVEVEERHPRFGWEEYRWHFATWSDAERWAKRHVRNRNIRTIVVVVTEGLEVHRYTFKSRFPTKAQRLVAEAVRAGELP